MAPYQINENILDFNVTLYYIKSYLTDTRT